jgi:hypothetical protein
MTGWIIERTKRSPGLPSWRTVLRCSGAWIDSGQNNTEFIIDRVRNITKAGIGFLMAARHFQVEPEPRSNKQDGYDKP